MNYRDSFLVLQWFYLIYDMCNLKGQDAKISSENPNYGPPCYQN